MCIKHRFFPVTDIHVNIWRWLSLPRNPNIQASRLVDLTTFHQFIGIISILTIHGSSMCISYLSQKFIPPSLIFDESSDCFHRNCFVALFVRFLTVYTRLYSFCEPVVDLTQNVATYHWSCYLDSFGCWVSSLIFGRNDPQRPMKWLPHFGMTKVCIPPMLWTQSP